MKAESGRRALVLVVEDDAPQREIAQALLEHYGFGVLTVASGEEAVGAARAHDVDLILMDVQLPGIDGWSACQALKVDDATRHLPVIVTSIYDIDRRMIAASGCDEFVPKPWRVNELVPAVRRLIEAGGERKHVPH